MLSKVHQLIWLASIQKQKKSLASFPCVNNPENSRNKPRKTVTTKNTEQEKNMSIENARAFYERVATDETFREQIRNVANDEQGQNIIRGAGYDFTAEDWNTVTEQLSQSDESELSDAELKAVAGGCSPRFTAIEEGIKAFVKKYSGKQER
ncbi:MAG: Nif11-like leader peptide family natural product precursor [Microcoleus sp. CSU_2_2]|nr:Nif11-like leader peptide family natural product precursor [Microcoleus sp. CSU_2_2]